MSRTAPRNVTITVVVENSVNRHSLLAEHGLAVHIAMGDHAVWLDTGAGRVLEPNARTLGLPLEEAEALVLSHGHYDHTGGLRTILQAAPLDLFAHPDAFRERFVRKASTPPRAVGLPDLTEADVERLARRLVKTTGPTEVTPGLIATGEIPRSTDFEDTGGAFFTDIACTSPDPLRDDQALFFETRDGTIVLLGCAHSGVINTLWHVQTLTGGKPIRAVIGGMHLVNASPDRLARTVAALRDLDIAHLAPGHCTGFPALVALREAFADTCVPISVGQTLRFTSI